MSKKVSDNVRNSLIDEVVPHPNTHKPKMILRRALEQHYVRTGGWEAFPEDRAMTARLNRGKTESEDLLQSIPES